MGSFTAVFSSLRLLFEQLIAVNTISTTKMVRFFIEQFARHQLLSFFLLGLSFFGVLNTFPNNPPIKPP